MVHRYRVIDEEDHKDKGSYRGHCNVKVCQAPNPQWYNTGTDSYYCQRCAMDINRANRDLAPDGLCVFDAHGWMDGDNSPPEVPEDLKLTNLGPRGGVDESNSQRKKREAREYNAKYYG